MLQLFAAVILATSSVAREDITVRMENNAGCSVRVQVLQFGAVRHTFFLMSGRAVMERVRVPSAIEPVSFRVIGIGCPFDRYTVDALNEFQPSLVLKLHNMPSLSNLAPYFPR